MIDKSPYLCIIQARLGSTRFPGKVLQLINGKTVIRYVWDAAKASKVGKTIVAWPERYPDVPEEDVLERFRRVSREFPDFPYIVRLTSDCPLITALVINKALKQFEHYKWMFEADYYANHIDGFDVQVFDSAVLNDVNRTAKEHVIADYQTSGGLSINTREDLERVKQLV